MIPGMATASTKQVQPPETADDRSTGSQLLRGDSALTGAPSGPNANPSAWNPGLRSSKPRSNTASTRRPAHSDGTWPEIRNHVVDHGAPHGVPRSTGMYAAAVSASATATAPPAEKADISQASRWA